MILASMLTVSERAALVEISNVIGSRLAPLKYTTVSATCAAKLAKLGVIDMRRGDRDGARLVRVNETGIAISRELRGLDPSGPEVVHIRRRP